MDVKFERTSTVAVVRGLLVVRYASSGVERGFPIAVVRAGPQFERGVEIVSAPGASQGWLEKPGDCLVVRVHEPARLEIGLRRSEPNGSLDASFQIDTLTGGKAAEPVPENARIVADPIKTAIVPAFQPVPAPSFEPAPSSQPNLQRSPQLQAPAPAPQVLHAAAARAPEPTATRDNGPEAPAISLIAHVAMRGDVEAVEDQWVAGPNAPAPIEGLVFRSESPERLSIEAQVLIAGAHQWTDWTPSEVYIGTRGRGLPLLALRLRVAGLDAARAELSAEALFLGAASISKKGRQIEFASSTGSDPLVGFKMSVQLGGVTPVGSHVEGSWRDRGSRVRVFRRSAGG